MKSIKKVAGMTLLEILIAMLIATILLLAVIRLFSRVGETYDLNVEALQKMETARASMAFIQDDLTQAGYLGCVLTAETDTAGAATIAILENYLDIQISGPINFDFAVSGVEGNSNPDSISVYYQKDKDIIAMASSDTLVFPTSDGIIAEAKNVYDDSGNAIFGAGDWLTISDCSRATAFVLTRDPFDPSTSANQYHADAANNEVVLLEHDTTNFGGFFNDTSDIWGYSYFAQGGAAFVNTFHHVQYLVADSEIDGGATQSLFRLENGEIPSKTNEIVRLVDDFQAEYGVDDDIDGVADLFVDASQIDGNNVVAVKVKLSVSGQEIENTIKIRNRGM